VTRARAEYLDLVAKHGLPEPPEGDILEMQWTASTGDWYLRTEAGWFYCRCDVRTRVWQGPSVYGPTV